MQGSPLELRHTPDRALCWSVVKTTRYMTPGRWWWWWWWQW